MLFTLSGAAGSVKVTPVLALIGSCELWCDVIIILLGHIMDSLDHVIQLVCLYELSDEALNI